MGQIIKSLPSVCLSVLLSVCHHSYGRNSHSILMKLYIIDRNPIGKNPFVGGQNPTIPSPIFPQFFTPVMHCQWEVPNTTVTTCMPVDRLWHVIAQRTLLGSCYAPSAEKCYNPISFSRKPKTGYQYTRTGNAARIQNIGKMQSLLSFIISKMEQREALYIRLTCFGMLLAILDTARMLYAWQRF